MKPIITGITKNSLPITLTHFPNLYTTQSEQDQYKFLFLVSLSNSVLRQNI